MPSKGDDLDALISSNITEHLSNVKFRYSDKGETHPSSRTLTVPGVFNNAFMESSMGMSSSMPTLSFEDRLLTNKAVANGGQVGVVGGSEYTVAATEPSGRGRTLLLLRKVNAT